MGTGYVRADTANNISNGNVIDADDLDNEFNAIETAFNSSTGHTHDGTSSEGAPITVIGPSQDVVAGAAVLRPKTNNTVDLGTSSLKYKDAYLAGDLSLGDAATIGGALSVTGAATLSSTLAVTGNQTNTGNLTVNGNTTLGNAATDTVTVNADVASNLIPSTDDAYDLGATGSEWRDAYIDGTAYIDTGSIDTANVATLNVSGDAAVTGNLTVTGGITATITGASDTANALTTARTISLGGDVTGSVSFDGSTDVTLTATIVDDSHSHVIADIDGLQTALDAKLSSSYTGDVDITGELVVDSYNETYSAVTSSSNSTTIDCETGNVFSHTLSENTTFTFSSPPSSGTAYGFSLKVVQDSSGSGYTVTWPSSVRWASATTPTLTSNLNAIDQFVFYTHDGGTNWYGFVSGQNLG